MAWIFVYTCVALLAAAYFWNKKARPKNFPPGPRGLPFIGSILSFGSKPELITQKWKQQYGDIYGLFLGRQPVVVLNDFNTIRKAFSEEIASGRDSSSTVQNEDCSIPMGLGLVTSEGYIWKIHRRFALSTLRDLGMGKNWLEETISTEVEELCQALRGTNGAPFNPKVHLTNSVANIISALIYGQRFPLNDPDFSRLTNLITQNIDGIKWDFVVQSMPFLMWFPNFIRTKILMARRNLERVVDFMREKVREHNEVMQKQEEAPDYLHAYQKEIEGGQRSPAELETFTEQQLLSSLMDLFGAGTETTSTTILWGLVFLVENPEVMRKVQAEIDDKVGRDHHLTNSDRALLPYTEAVILEIQRCASLLPFGVPHRNSEEMTIDGYTVPKHSMIVANMYSMHRDPRWWKNGENFDPTHFLDENDKLIRPDGFAPFCIGKRACPGEALAKMELFLFMANLLRCFTLEVPPQKSVSHKNCVSGFTLSPSAFELIFAPRT